MTVSKHLLKAVRVAEQGSVAQVDEIGHDQGCIFQGRLVVEIEPFFKSEVLPCLTIHGEYLSNLRILNRNELHTSCNCEYLHDMLRIEFSMLKAILIKDLFEAVRYFWLEGAILIKNLSFIKPLTLSQFIYLQGYFVVAGQ